MTWDGLANVDLDEMDWHGWDDMRSRAIRKIRQDLE